MAGANPDRWGLLTIVRGVVSEVSEVGAMLAKCRDELRRTIAAARRTDSRWDSVAVRGWLEVDAVDREQIMPLLGRRRQRQLVDLGLPQVDGPIWVVTIHALVRHDELSRDEVMSNFSRRWPAEGQVHIRPPASHLSLLQNTQNCVRYALKNKCEINIEGRPHPWPASWVAEFYTWQEEWSQSFKRLTVSVRAKVPVHRITTDEQFCHHNITGATPVRSLQELFASSPFLAVYRERQNFKVAAHYPLRVDFRSTASRLRYRAARGWCEANCADRWGYEAWRSRLDTGGASPAVFRFARREDAEAFARAARYRWGAA